MWKYEPAFKEMNLKLKEWVSDSVFERTTNEKNYINLTVFNSEALHK